MNHQSLFYYANGFRQLHTNFTRQNNQSPQKFILMLGLWRCMKKAACNLNVQAALSCLLKYRLFSF